MTLSPLTFQMSVNAHIDGILVASISFRPHIRSAPKLVKNHQEKQ